MHTCVHTVCSVVSDSSATPWIVAHLLWEFSGQNIGVGCHLLLEGILLIQRSNLSPLHLLSWQVVSSPLHSLGSPCQHKRRGKNNFERNEGCEKVQQVLKQIPHSGERSETGKIESGWKKDR